jgi:nucleoid-associated protein YgaU
MKRSILGTVFFFVSLFVFARLNPVTEGPLANNEYYKKSVELANKAQEAMDAADYEAAAEYAVESQKYAALSRQYIEGVLGARQRPSTQSPSGLAAEYEVKYTPLNRDSLWKIAGYSFVYGNSREWRRLYEHNRSSLRYPDNPNLIYPGQILVIPSINGEARSGRQ